jgi:hypothetical protein
LSELSKSLSDVSSSPLAHFLFLSKFTLWSESDSVEEWWFHRVHCSVSCLFRLIKATIKKFYTIIGRCWAKYLDLSVASRSIIFRCRRQRQISDLRATDKSRYFAMAEFNNCFIIYRLVFVFSYYQLVFVFSMFFSSSKDGKSLSDSSAKRAMLTFQERRWYFLI